VFAAHDASVVACDVNETDGNAMVEAINAAGGKLLEQSLDASPLGRFGQPTDIAIGCLNLARDESPFVTGTELVIDGGMMAKDPGQNKLSIRAPLHPRQRRCSSVAYGRVFSLLAPCWRGAAAPSLLDTLFRPGS
jgi:hypothetical protein